MYWAFSFEQEQKIGAWWNIELPQKAITSPAYTESVAGCLSLRRVDQGDAGK